MINATPNGAIVVMNNIKRFAREVFLISNQIFANVAAAASFCRDVVLSKYNCNVEWHTDNGYLNLNERKAICPNENGCR